VENGNGASTDAQWTGSDRFKIVTGTIREPRHVARRVVRGVSGVVCGVWCVVCGVSCVVGGVWRLAFGVWRLAFGVWRAACGVRNGGIAWRDGHRTLKLSGARRTPQHGVATVVRTGVAWHLSGSPA
jgi:hypothetical protein